MTKIKNQDCFAKEHELKKLQSKIDELRMLLDHKCAIIEAFKNDDEIRASAIISEVVKTF